MQPARRTRWLWVAATLSLGLSLTPWGKLILYPFRLFTTWVHECGHALVTLMVGGSVSSIVIEPDTSGVTRSLLPAGRVGVLAWTLWMTSVRNEQWASPNQ